jgi:hypothetical protein
MSAGGMDQQQAIMLAADEETMQGMEDTIDCQEHLEQGRQFFDALCLEYQGKEVLSGRKKRVLSCGLKDLQVWDCQNIVIML